MNVIAVFLMAITMNAQTGDEIGRERVKDSPTFETIDKCAEYQSKTGIQHPELKDGLRTITVVECVAATGEAKEG